MKDARAALSCVLACSTGIAAWTAATPAWTAEVRLETGAVSSLVLTDNINLAPAGQTETGLITQVGSVNRLRVSGARVNANADLNLFLNYLTGSGGGFQASGDGRGFGTLEALKDLLFIDAEGSLQQQLITPGGRVSGTGVGRRGDVANTQTIGISPYLVGRAGGWAEGELRYRYDRVFTDNSTLGNSTSSTLGNSTENRGTLTVRSGDRFTRLQLTSLLEISDFETTQVGGNVKRKTAELSAEYPIIRQFALLAMVGYETFQGSDFLNPPVGAIWNVGFRVRPGPRSELSFTYGQRYGGSAINGSLRYDVTPSLTLRASVADSIDSPQQRLVNNQLVLGVDAQGTIINLTTGLPVTPAERGLGLQGGVSRTRTVQASLVGTRGRNTFLVGIVNQDRNFSIGPDQMVFSANASWNRQLSPYLAGSVQLGYQAANNQGNLGTTDTLIGRLDVSYQVAANATLSASYVRTNRFASNPQDEYTENAVVIGARVGF